MLPLLDAMAVCSYRSLQLTWLAAVVILVVDVAASTVLGPQQARGRSPRIDWALRGRQSQRRCSHFHRRVFVLYRRILVLRRRSGSSRIHSRRQSLVGGRGTDARGSPLRGLRIFVVHAARHRRRRRRGGGPFGEILGGFLERGGEDARLIIDHFNAEKGHRSLHHLPLVRREDELHAGGSGRGAAVAASSSTLTPQHVNHRSSGEKENED